jgi:hypothetical protein
MLRTELAKFDDGAAVAVHELHGILNRHDVIAPAGVDDVDESRQRRALPAACRSRDQHQPLARLGQTMERSR